MPPIPTVKLSQSDAQCLHLGAPEKANVRTIYQFIHPAGPQELPAGDGIDHPGAGEQLEHHALSHP